MRWWPFGGRGGRHSFGAAVTALPTGPLRLPGLPADEPAAVVTTAPAPWSGDDDLMASSLADLLRGSDDDRTVEDSRRWSPFDLGLDDEHPVEVSGAGPAAVASAPPADDDRESDDLALPSGDACGLPVLTLLPDLEPGDDGRADPPAPESPVLSLLPELQDGIAGTPLDAGLPDGPPRTADLPDAPPRTADAGPPVALPGLAVPGLAEEWAPGESVPEPPSVAVPVAPLPPVGLPVPLASAPVPVLAQAEPPPVPTGPVPGALPVSSPDRSSAVFVPAPGAPSPVDPLPWLALPAAPSTTPETAPVAPLTGAAPPAAVPGAVPPATIAQQDVPQVGASPVEVLAAPPFVPTGPPASELAGLLPLQRGASVPAPRVRLGFRDGSTADLPAGSESSRALEELARILLTRT